MSYEGFLNMKLNLPLYGLPEKYWGTCFQQLTTYMYEKKGRNQGRIQKIQKEGAEETDDAVLHCGSICDQTLG